MLKYPQCEKQHLAYRLKREHVISFPIGYTVYV